MALIDLSHPLDEKTPCYPGDAPLALQKVKNLKEDHYVSYRITSTLHTGTHIDLPMHLVEDNRFMEDFPLSAFMGPGVLLNVQGEEVISFKKEYEKRITRGDIVLLYTGFDAYFGEPRYFTQHPVLSKELSDFLIEKQIKMLGIDFPSPDRVPFTIHKALLQNNILLLENMTNLKALESILHFDIMAFPLKIQSEASFVRAVAKV